MVDCTGAIALRKRLRYYAPLAIFPAVFELGLSMRNTTLALPKRNLVKRCARLGCSVLAGTLTATMMIGFSTASTALANRASAAPGLTTDGMTFEQAMSVGYAASRQGDFNTALINFQRALMIRPNQPYAAAAADNMAYYIEHARVSARQREIDQLEARLVEAHDQNDWVCAATTIDELVTYTQPKSLNRERLIGQRGEVSGLLDARINHESWSTVCSARRPVY
ncbi:MAG: hypothetical protein AAFO06_14000 [Cyanobacteria bacterium J06597_16]